MAYNPKKIAGGVAGGALLMFGAVGGIGATAGLPQTADADPIATTHAVGDNVVTAQWFNEDDVSYVSVANAQGAFTFNQEGVTPNDELFNVFGTALTSMCSKPATELRESFGETGSDRKSAFGRAADSWVGLPGFTGNHAGDNTRWHVRSGTHLDTAFFHVRSIFRI